MTSASRERVSLERAAGLVQAFIDDAPIGFALLDRELRFVQVNHRLAEMNGAPAAAHVGRRPHDVLPGLPVESYLPLVERALAGEPSEAVEVSGQTPSRPGVTRWWLESWSAVRGSTGEVIGVAAFVVEITDRKQAEARLRESEVRELAHAEALARLAAKAAHVATVPELAAVVANHAPETVDAAFANVGLTVPSRDRVRVFHGDTLDESIAERWREVSVAAPVPLSEAIRTGAPVFVRSPAENARRYPSVAADTERAGLAATASLPLLDRGGEVLGAIGFAWRTREEFGAALRARLQTVAELAAQSLQRATLYEAERRTRERVALMAEVGAALSNAGSLTDRMSRMCMVLTPRFADLAIAALAGLDATPGPVAIAHRDPGALAPLRDRAAAVATALAAGRLPAVGEAQHIPDVSAQPLDESVWEPPTLEVLRSLRARSFVGVPLRAGNRVVGAFMLANTTSGRYFDSDDVSFVSQLGERAGLLLDNARLAEAEHEIARELQQRLLPSSLTVPSTVAVAARYRPADVRLGVGGDWYDVAERTDGALAIAVGDIVGHGPRAAATMGQLRSAFAALAPTAPGPAELLHRLDAFAARSVDARFSTVCSAFLDPVAGSLRYACAGHPPPLILHPDGRAITLEHGRSSLISVSDAPRPQAETTLPVGARLLLYTDGLIERRTVSIDAGLSRLVAAARRFRSLELEDFCDAVLAEMPADQSTVDDSALLCIELVARVG